MQPIIEGMTDPQDLEYDGRTGRNYCVWVKLLLLLQLCLCTHNVMK